MYEQLNPIQSEVRIRELHRQAEHHRLASHASNGKRPVTDGRASSTVVIRIARSEDRSAIDRLAQLDGHPPLEDRTLEDRTLMVAEVEGEVRAALPLDGGEPIADPFRPTAELVEMLRLRAGHLDGGLRRSGLRRRLSRLLPRPARARPATAPSTPGNARLLIPRD
jgi:hypothetical protein